MVATLVSMGGGDKFYAAFYRLWKVWSYQTLEGKAVITRHRVWERTSWTENDHVGMRDSLV